jgi:hypothetical protein
MRSPVRAILAASLLAFAAVPPTLHAQATTGTIYGTVVDQSKSVMPGVTIEVNNVENGAIRTLVTDENGRYRALSLPPGAYRVSAELQGFSPAVRENLAVQIGGDVLADLTLKVGGVAEQVTVQGAATDIDLSTAVAGGVVSSTQIAELPLNGRSFMQLATLQPGVTVSRATSADFTGGFGNTQLSIGGARPEMTGYLLEGTNIADISDKAPSSMAGVLLGVDAVKEFSVQTHDYNAEFGRAAGGVISAVTKSGTNNLHGTLFEFLRNSKFDAPNYFDPIDPTTGRQATPPFTRNQFGGTAGGPIVKNKLFYFGSYEGLRQNLSLTHLAVLPNQNAHNGLLPVGANGALTMVPINPLVKPYLDLLFPIPNGRDFGDGTAELRHTDIDPTHENFFVGKIDWQLGNSDSMFLRASSDRSGTLSHQDHPLFVDPTATDTRYFTYQDQHIFSSRVLNVARGAINRTARNDDFVPTIQIPQSLYFTTDPHFGSITIQSGVTAPGTTATKPADYRQTIFQVSDTLTVSRATHTLKVGGDVQGYHFDGSSYSRYGGEFRFTDLSTFLRGTVLRFTGNLPGTDTKRNMRQTYVALFAQDEWRPWDNLTLNYGLRYEFFTIPYDLRGRVAGLLSFSDLESGPNGVTPGSDLFKNPSKLDFAPRLGIAWNPFGAQKTSVKAGGGIFYQPLTTSYYRGTTFRVYPYFAGVDIRNVPTFGPAVQQLLAQGTGSAVQKRSEFIDYNARQPYTAQYHMSLQHEIGGVVADLGYVGSRGYHLPFYSDPNAVPVRFNAADGHYQVVPGATLLFPDWGRIRTRTNVARSWYNGMTASVNRRYANGLLFQGSYTFGNSRDTWSGGLIGGNDFDNGAGSATNYFHPESEIGPSSFDVRHTLVFNAVYQLPFGKGLTGPAAQIAGGWQLGVVANYASGIPFTPLIGFDYAKDLSSDPNPQKPDWASGFNAKNAIIGSPDNWFNVNAFVLPPPGEYGTVGRNSLRGPDLKEVDLSIFKNTAVAKTKSNLQFRLEVFNLFNRANFATPTAGALFSSNGTSIPSAARVTRTTTTSRQVQLGVKVVF